MFEGEEGGEGRRREINGLIVDRCWMWELCDFGRLLCECRYEMESGGRDRPE